MRALAGEAGSFASLLPSSMSRRVIFPFATAIIKAVNRFASIGIASGHGRHMVRHLDRALIFVGSTESRPTRKQLS